MVCVCVCVRERERERECVEAQPLEAQGALAIFVRTPDREDVLLRPANTPATVDHYLFGSYNR